MTILSDGALSRDLTTLPCYGGTKDLADSQEVSQAEGGLFRVHEAGYLMLVGMGRTVPDT